jgi:hypothetical protein
MNDNYSAKQRKQIVNDNRREMRRTDLMWECINKFILSVFIYYVSLVLEGMHIDYFRSINYAYSIPKYNQQSKQLIHFLNPNYKKH